MWGLEWHTKQLFFCETNAQIILIYDFSFGLLKLLIGCIFALFLHLDLYLCISQTLIQSDLQCMSANL